MKIVAAPLRQFKTYSMILGMLIAGFDSIVLMFEVLADTEVLSVKAVLLINAILGLLIVPAKLILQNISVNTQQKIAIVAASAAQPIKKGSKDVAVKIDKFTVPSTPGGV